MWRAPQRPACAYRLSIAPRGFAGVGCDIIDPASEGWKLWMGKAEVASLMGREKPRLQFALWKGLQYREIEV